MNDSLYLNGTFYSPDNLREFSLSRLEDKDTPLWEKQVFSFINDWLSDSESIVTYTSGTTGNRKIVSLDKNRMRASARLTCSFFGLEREDTALLCLPAQYIAGKMMIVRAFTGGLNLIILEPNSDPLAHIDQDFRFAAMLPLQVFNTLRHRGGAAKLNRIGDLITGGAEIHPGLMYRIAKLRNRSWHTYGMTETITHVAVRRINGDHPEDHYTALPGIEFSTDKRGCLVITAPHLADEPVFTDDLAEVNDPGHFVFLGRYDNMINSGGIKIIPEVLEQKLELHFSSRFILAGAPDEKLGEKLVMIVENIPQEEQEPFKLKAAEIFAGLLEKHERPGDIQFISRFETNESGKIIRPSLK